MRPLIGRKALGVLSALFLSATMVLPGMAQDSDQPRTGGTLQIGFRDDTSTLDPTFSIQWSERQVLYLIYNTLVRAAPDFSLHPELAESWEIEDEGRRIVFRLRQGVTFHDGTPFNAEAVKWNLDRRMDEAVGSPQRSQLVQVITGVDVIDEYSVAITTAEPFPPLLSYLAERPGFMVSPTAAEALGDDFGSNPVGTGPFVFREWSRGNRIVLERNENYWEEGLPYLDSIVFNDIGAAVVGVQRLIVGEIDYVDSLSPQNVQMLSAAEDIVLDPITVGRWYSYQWQWDVEPFNNPILRRAIAHAIDRDRLNAVTMNGEALISNGPTPAGLWWYSDALEGYEYNPDLARELVREAGAEGLEIALSTPEDTILRQLNQLVQEQLNAVGLNVTLAPEAMSEWYGRVVQRQINFTPMRWTQRADPDGLLSILFHSGGHANSTGYSNPEVDSLLEQARRNFDQDERKALYDRAHEVILQDLPYVPIYFSVEYAAMNERVRGFEWIPDQVPRFYNVWLAE